MNFLDLVVAFTSWREIVFADDLGTPGTEGWIGWFEGDTLVASYFEHCQHWDSPITRPASKWLDGHKTYRGAGEYRSAIRGLFPFQGRRNKWTWIRPGGFATVQHWQTREWRLAKPDPFSVGAYQDAKARAAGMVANARRTLAQFYLAGGVPLPLEIGDATDQRADPKKMVINATNITNCTFINNYGPVVNYPLRIP